MGLSAYLPDEEVLSSLLDRALSKTPEKASRISSRPVIEEAPETPRMPSSLTALVASRPGVGSVPSPIQGAPSNTSSTSERTSMAPSVSASLAPDTRRQTKVGMTDGALDELGDMLGVSRSIDGRFSAFATWLRRQLGATSVFIVDAEGLPMTVDGVGEDQRALAGSLAQPFQAARRLVPDIIQSSARLRMASGAFLEMTWCDTVLGKFGVGTTSSAPVPVEWSIEIGPLLQQVLERGSRFREGKRGGVQ